MYILGIETLNIHILVFFTVVKVTTLFKGQMRKDPSGRCRYLDVFSLWYVLVGVRLWHVRGLSLFCDQVCRMRCV